MTIWIAAAGAAGAPVPTTFDDWSNRTQTVGRVNRTIARGTRTWPAIARSVEVEVIRSLITSTEADRIVDILREDNFDRDEDTVDSMRTFEFYLEKSGSAAALATINGKPDRSPRVMAQRKPLRDAVSSITRPIIEERVLPWLRSRFPSPPGGAPLQLCFSFIRRYRDGERKTHKAHFDIQAYATIVVSLKSAGNEFDGGLYVSASGDGAREWIALQKGDAVVHQSDLLHGVDVTRGERWSWVMWFKPAATAAACPQSDMADWNANEAEAGDPVAQFLTARRSRSPRDASKWLQRSADAGFTRAVNELGAAFLFGTGGLRKDVAKATALLERAAPFEADAAFNLGLAALRGAGGGEKGAIEWFAKAAAMGSLQAMSNMGVAHFRGAGDLPVDLDRAERWFRRAGDGKAMFSLAAVAREREPPREAEARRWEEDACRRAGHAEACAAVRARQAERSEL